jgi:hypothetical protein
MTIYLFFLAGGTMLRDWTETSDSSRPSFQKPLATLLAIGVGQLAYGVLYKLNT